ncbi:Rft protein-domain-containing protein [Suillus bovinus]|uniref:Rft protein-domain-containing protein n=1 Tax=Suillus bovinus TaxID=48563 RepID=UPI001B86EED8|nr:Rft protein-domain-containing protein [Suillus bovinus]KAG2158043.1 Rft protein-domain-containing protein [Suillus bovinus]
MNQQPSSSRSKDKDGGLLKRSLNSLFSLMGLQLVSRLLTFVLNQALVRLASPQAYGTAAIQFEFILSTILFLSREGVRNALLRAWPRNTTIHTQGSTLNKDDHAPALTNLSTLPIILGLPVSLAMALAYATLASDDARRQPHFHVALSTYVFAALSELFSEPMHNRAMGEVRTGARVRAEGLGITCKTIVTYLILLYDSTRPDSGEFALVAFALGQLTYSNVVFFSYAYQMGYPTFWPIRLATRQSSKASVSRSTFYRIASQYFDVSSLHMSLTMTMQSIVKHILTEGDKIILSWWSPLDDQGGYAIAVNYGSLVARIVFQPLEEICRVYFSRILCSPAETKSTSTGAQFDRRSLAQASEILLSLVSIQLACSVLVLVFATVYLPIVLHLLLPSQYLSTCAPKVLAAWIWYIPVLAINGVLEAFFSSIATSQDLRRQSRWLIGFSIVFIVSAVGFYASGFGDVSLVYANIINLAARIIYAAQYASTFFKRNKITHGWHASTPTWQFLLVAMLSYLAISMTNIHHQADILLQTKGRGAILSVIVVSHLAQGAGMGLCCIATWWLTSGRYLVRRAPVKTD